MALGAGKRERARSQVGEQGDASATGGPTGRAGGPAATSPAASQIGVHTEIRRPVRRPRDYVRPALWVAAVVALAIAFEITYGQAPLYTGNQHTYVLHGLAQAGIGLLEHDWQANTLDPAPITSLLVALAASIDGEWLVLLFHALLIGAYGIALVGIGVTLLRLDDVPRRLFFIALLLAVHSWVASQIAGPLPDDLRSLATKGLAGQYAPGLTFQPSLFGVLIVVSLLAYARGRPFVAIGLACAAAVFHPTYLISAFVLAGVYLADQFARTGSRRRVAQGAALAMTILAPVAAYALIAFAPAPGEAHEAAQGVLVDFRIPHHAKPSKWFAPDDAVRLAIVAGGLVVAARTVLFPVLALATAAGAGLTALQLATSSDTLALLFPWRVSVWLVPVCAAILLAALTRVAFALGRSTGGLLARAAPNRAWRVRSLARGGAVGLAALLIAVSVVAGLPRVERVDAEPEREPFASLVRGEAAPGALFLVPPRQYELRVAAGVPIYIDYKSNPYADLEVLEWRRRLRAASAVYRDGRPRCRRLAALVRRERITHVVTERPSRRPPCAFLEEVRQAGELALYRTEPGAAVRGGRATRPA